jgi:NAD(P)-dependent dehydrogenase (short-subunit alcohol dehydrogenase family)
MIYTRTKQAPIHSGFGAETTAQQVLGERRLDGMVAIVTGGHAGLGLSTTRALITAGASVVVAPRTPERARVALAGLDRITVEPLDLAVPASVDAFARRFLESGKALGLLVNNAGIMATPLQRDARGIESQLATNHLGHFQLTLRLWPALTRAGARVVSLSSRGHARSAFDFEDPNFQRRPYDKWLAYGQSKTANALFAVALDVRGAEHGVRAFSVHPGAVETDLMRSMSADEQRAALATAREISSLKTADQGAATSIWCGTSPELAGMGGVYCEDVDIAEAASADAPLPRGVRPWARDPDLAEELWKRSEEWTGVTL